MTIEEQNQQELGLAKRAVKKPLHSWLVFHSMRQFPRILPFPLNISRHTKSKGPNSSSRSWGGTPMGDAGQRSRVALRTEPILRSREG